MLHPESINLYRVEPLEDNAKRHDIEGIKAAIRQWGMIDRLVINTVTGHLLSGHGRVLALMQMAESNEPIPENITTDVNGEWCAPVDYVTVDPDDEAILAAAMNQLTIAGGYDKEKLLNVLAAVKATRPQLLGATGFRTADLDALLKAHHRTVNNLIGDSSSNGSEPRHNSPAPAFDEGAGGAGRPAAPRAVSITCPHCGQSFSPGE